MKMNVGEVLAKINDIDGRIVYLQCQLPDPCYEAQEPLCDVIKLLEEHKDMLTDAKNRNRPLTLAKFSRGIMRDMERVSLSFR